MCPDFSDTGGEVIFKGYFSPNLCAIVLPSPIELADDILVEVSKESFYRLQLNSQTTSSPPLLPLRSPAYSASCGRPPTDTATATATATDIDTDTDTELRPASLSLPVDGTSLVSRHMHSQHAKDRAPPKPPKC
ncbi:hypothetical protein E4U58_001519 [Claviceps cyperi]|nr:hypothetical protein E4U58_001519 [Claviceps cyperi]